jgi:hypothetical protein
MDYTQSPQNVVHPGTGHRMHEDNQALPTVLTDSDVNQVIWSLMEVIAQAGLTPAAFAADTPASYQVLREALKKLYLQRTGDANLTGDYRTSGTWSGAFSLNLPNAYLNVDVPSNNFIINFDGNDYLYYDRDLNALVMAIAGVNRVFVDQFGPGRNDDASTPNGLPRLSQVQEMAPRAVVTFNGFNGAIYYSRGVSSVTKISTGCYEINFSTPMPSANYAMFGSATESDGVTIGTSNPGGNNHIAGCGLAGTVSVKTVSKMRVYCFEAAGSPATVGPEDASFISVCFVGG